MHVSPNVHLVNMRILNLSAKSATASVANALIRQLAALSAQIAWTSCTWSRVNALTSAQTVNSQINRVPPA